ncbi:hypothetical protein GRR92_05945 [Lactococcus lactis subsp. lactis]|uniref:YolD-like family protein n=2 Tax=Streptococcaceae TaxID=1300 RepID=T0SIN3_LACLC|nr:hypothetical protein llh_7815 [Lactococcus cremoris subsp. cremoris A76]AGY45548.1 hypothetical protein P620_06695 [Lactococcus lactis subsp. lactis KLDS 4.0325]EQC58221.1 hypothetical protein LLT6_10050 [Lactococcus cremoris subsp. cremoris TIFN6]MBR8673885.1 hypothetical protein [Lactococcus lactis subsp. lactis]OJH47220.1 hypothetical protein LGL2_06360 [Lactococcus lactis subsp. lactis bv. diacetylactis]TRW69660.1 hypothetical protein FNJ58_08285 [Lactococcus lactis]
MSIIEGTKRVDRSYSSSEAIRNYQDRRIMKWNPFATAELAAAHREYDRTSDREDVESQLETDVLITRLTAAQQFPQEVLLTLRENNTITEMAGTVYAWDENKQPVIKTTEGHYQVLALETILNITVKGGTSNGA